MQQKTFFLPTFDRRDLGEKQRGELASVGDLERAGWTDELGGGIQICDIMSEKYDIYTYVMLLMSPMKICHENLPKLNPDRLIN